METPTVRQPKIWSKLLGAMRRLFIAIPKIYWLLLGLFLGCMIIGHLFDSIGPLSGNVVFNIGRVGFAITVLQPVYYLSKRNGSKWSEYIQNGLAAGLFAIFLGGFLYSLCLFTPAESGCIGFADPPLLLEKLGRFIFLGSPLIAGFSLLIGSLFAFALGDQLSGQLNIQVAIIFALAVGCFMIVWFISDSIRELGLVAGGMSGPSLGDIDPMRHGLFAIGLGGIGTVALAVFSTRNPGTEIYKWLLAVDALLLLSFVFYIQTAFNPQVDIIMPGTGIGVIIAWISAGVSLFYVAIFVVRWLIPKKARLALEDSASDATLQKMPAGYIQRAFFEQGAATDEISVSDNVEGQKTQEHLHKIFLSYRRDDSADITGRMYDRLIQHFDVFKDVLSIPLGVDFTQYIDTKVAECAIFIVVIGPDWMGIETNTIRIEEPGDFVRIEVESALQREIPIIPTFVSGAEMPKEEEIPLKLKPLTLRQGIAIRTDPDFHQDMDRLITSLQELLNTHPDED